MTSQLSFRIRNPNSPGYHNFREQLETGPSGIQKYSNGKVYPPTVYHGKGMKGPIYNHPVREVIMEPGVSFTCPDCHTTHEGLDHFKYSCNMWAGRVRLAQGFAYCKSIGLFHGQHHLNNEAIDAMQARGVDLVRVNNQHPDWLPHEPLYDRDTVTGQWMSTGIVPTQVYQQLPAEMRIEPVHQDLSVSERAEMHADPGNRSHIHLNSPRHVLDRISKRQEEQFHEQFYNGQCELKERILPSYQALMQEYDQIKASNERLESQISVCKAVVNHLSGTGEIGPLSVALINMVFDAPGRPNYIPPAVVIVSPDVAVPQQPFTATKVTSLGDIAVLEDMDDFNPTV